MVLNSFPIGLKGPLDAIGDVTKALRESEGRESEWERERESPSSPGKPTLGILLFFLLVRKAMKVEKVCARLCRASLTTAATAVVGGVVVVPAVVPAAGAAAVASTREAFPT